MTQGVLTICQLVKRFYMQNCIVLFFLKFHNGYKRVFTSSKKEKAKKWEFWKERKCKSNANALFSIFHIDL